METQMDQDRRSVLKATGATALAAALPLTAGAQPRAGSGLKDLNQLDAGEIAKRVARREISPVEVIDAALTRLDETHPAINAFTAVDAEGARRAARGLQRWVGLGVIADNIVNLGRTIEKRAAK